MDLEPSPGLVPPEGSGPFTAATTKATLQALSCFSVVEPGPGRCKSSGMDGIQWARYRAHWMPSIFTGLGMDDDDTKDDAQSTSASPLKTLQSLNHQQVNPS